MQKLAMPKSLDAISTKRMSTTGMVHLIQCLSLTDSVSKSERAAAAMKITRTEILRVDRRGSATGYWEMSSGIKASALSLSAGLEQAYGLV